MSLVISSNNFSTLCSFFIYSGGNVFLNRATGCGSRGQTLRLSVDGSIAINLRLAVCGGFLLVLLFFFLIISSYFCKVQY